LCVIKIVERIGICFSVLGKKNKKMKGKTFGLIEFLADGASGPGAGQTVITRKSTNWADDVENEDGRYLSFIHHDFFYVD